METNLYCIVQSTKVAGGIRDSIVLPSQLYRRNENNAYEKCTTKWLEEEYKKPMNDRETVRIRVVGNNDIASYERVIVLKLTGTRSEAEKYTQSPSTRGKGARKRKPKITIDTPDVVLSPKKIFKHRAALRNEIQLTKTEKKQKATGHLKAKMNTQDDIAKYFNDNVDDGVKTKAISGINSKSPFSVTAQVEKIVSPRPEKPDQNKITVLNAIEKVKNQKEVADHSNAKKNNVEVKIPEYLNDNKYGEDETKTMDRIDSDCSFSTLTYTEETEEADLSLSQRSIESLDKQKDPLSSSFPASPEIKSGHSKSVQNLLNILGDDENSQLAGDQSLIDVPCNKRPTIVGNIKLPEQYKIQKIQGTEEANFVPPNFVPTIDASDAISEVEYENTTDNEKIIPIRQKRTASLISYVPTPRITKPKADLKMTMNFTAKLLAAREPSTDTLVGIKPTDTGNNSEEHILQIDETKQQIPKDEIATLREKLELLERKNQTLSKELQKNKNLLKKNKTKMSSHDTSCVTKLMPKLNKILSSIKGKKHHTCSMGAVNVQEEADENGFITVVDDIRIDCDSYAKAADACTLQKRVNEILKGMWTLEERLNLTVETRHENQYRQVTDDEECSVTKICMTLDGKDTSNERLVQKMRKTVRTCMSKKLKNDKYRNRTGLLKQKKGKRALSGTEKQKKVPKVKKSSTRKLSGSENSHASDDNEPTKEKPKKDTSSDESIAEQPQKQTKYKRLHNYISSTSDDDDENVRSVASDDMRTKIALHQLITKLSSSMYNGCGNVEDSYTWEELKNETKFTESEMKDIFTCNCCVFLEGKCRIIHPRYESEVLTYMCELSMELEYDVSSVKMTNLLIPTTEIYPQSIVEYIFKKYTVPSHNSIEAADELSFKWNIEKIVTLKLYNLLVETSEWNYNDLIDEYQSDPYCDVVEMTDELLLNARGIVERPNEKDTGNWTVRRISTFSTITGLDNIVRNYLRIFEKQ